MLGSSRRRVLCWIIGVWWLFVGAAEGSGDYDSYSCSREGRNFKPRPQVPCDLVKNTFCDTSGDSYPWSQLRKYVFENQGLIKRMYGYQTHYTILKDELLEAIYDGGHHEEPHQMYLPETELKDHLRESSKSRNSVRSNAFKNNFDDAPDESEFKGYPSLERGEHHGNHYEDAQIEFESDRRANGRHLDGRTSTSRAMKIPNGQYSGRRSISSASSIKDKQNNQFETKKNHKNKDRNVDPGRAGTVKITQSYSTKSTSEGVATPASTMPNTEKQEQEHESKLPLTTTQEPARTTEATPSSTLEPEHTSQPPDLASSQETTVQASTDALAEDLNGDVTESYHPPLDADEWVTSGPEAYVYSANSDEPAVRQGQQSTTKATSSTATGPRPPSSEEQDAAMASTVTSATLPETTDEELLLATTTMGPTDYMDDDPVLVASEDEGVLITFSDEKLPVMDDELVSSQLSSETRTSAGIELDEITLFYDAPNEQKLESSSGGEVSKNKFNEDDSRSEADSFKFPDEVGSSVITKSPEYEGEQKKHNSRRQNTRRPASGESRQPSNFKKPGQTLRITSDKSSQYSNSRQRPSGSTGRQPQPTRAQPSSESSFDGDSREPAKSTIRRTPSKQQQQQQATWRRPISEEVQPSSSPSSALPTPPTPSTVPTPAPSLSFKKGVNACPVETDVVAPYWANNTRGEVLALLNLSPFEQYVHWEKCRFEYRQMYCRPGCRCEQQYRLHRMLAFDPSNDCRGVFSDWFRFPSGCVCMCYDLPDDVSKVATSYSRNPRLSSHGEDEEESLVEEDDASSDLRESRFGTSDPEVRELHDGDLTDVFFESEDELHFIGEEEEGEAQERMDSNFLDEQLTSEEFEPEMNPIRAREENVEEIHDKQSDNLEAVLDGEPVHSLYSRVETVQSKPKVPLSNITPQRRPRPHILSPRRSSMSRPVQQLHLPGHNQQPGYNLRFAQSSRVLQYAPPNSLPQVSPFQFQPQQPFRGRNRYYPNSPRYRSLNNWNPQASFPSSLSNPRFNKYIDAPSNQAHSKTFQHNIAPNTGSNNLNFNHLMQPSPLVKQHAQFGVTAPPEGQAATHGTLDVHTPHYFFNLTSHLIRTQQLDSHRPSATFKSREPRSVQGEDRE